VVRLLYQVAQAVVLPPVCGTSSSKSKLGLCSTAGSEISEGRAFGPAPRAWYARHGQQLGGESPLQEAVVLTASRRQRRHREVGSEGSPRQSSDPRNTNRIQGWAARMSRQDTVKSATTKGLSGRCGGARAKAAVLIRGDLVGCRSNPAVLIARWERTGEESAAAIVPARDRRSRGISIAGKGQTSVRGSDRTDSRSAHRPRPSHLHDGSVSGGRR
jgi:hypothetical protein